MGVSLSPSSRGRGRRRPRRAAMAEINVTPLVDVMLVLLIIFMVTVTLPAVGVPIELPESRANPVDEVPDAITVSVNGEGRVFLGDDPVPAGGLPDALARIDRRSDGELPRIVLRGDRSIDYGRIMAVMGELNRAGFSSIDLVMEPSGSAP